MNIKIPRLIAIFCGVIVLYHVMTALTLRFNLTGFGVPEITFWVQYFAQRMSARNLAFAILLGIALWRREARVLAYLLIFWPLVEIQDFASTTIDMAQGKVDPGLAVFGVPILTFSFLSAWAGFWLLRTTQQER